MIRRLLRRLQHDFRETLTTSERSALVAYTSFTLTTVGVRGLTTAIKYRLLPVHDLTAGGIHIHHYLPGIALLTTAGAFGLRGSSRPVVHCIVGGTYGAGCALIVDELPLLLDLRDVYWKREGRWGVELALALIASVGAYFVGIPLWRGLREEAQRHPPQAVPNEKRGLP